VCEFIGRGVEAVDNADGDFRVILAEHGWTEDGERYYPLTTLAAAAEAGLYDGVKMYINHEGTEDGVRGHRDVAAWAATVQPGSVHMTETGLEAIAHVHAPALLTVLGDPVAKAGIGLSQDSYVQYREKVIDGKPATVIEQVLQVNSVDWVPSGNTRGRVLEAETQEDDMTIAEMTLEELREARPDLVDALLQEHGDAGTSTADKEAEEMDKQALAAVEAEKAALQAELDAVKAQVAAEQEQRASEAAVTTLVAASGLAPHEAARVIERLRGQAIPEAEREARVQEAVDAERAHTAAVLAAAGVQTRVTEAGAAEAGNAGGYSEEAHREWCRRHGVEYIPLKAGE